MKNIINKTIRYLIISITIIIILLAMLTGISKMAVPYLTKHHSQIEQMVSNFIKTPIKIEHIDVGTRGLEPTLKFQNVMILNEQKTKSLLQIKELQIDIDLIKSLMSLSIKPGLLIIKGIDLKIYQNENGVFYLKNFKTTNSDSEFSSTEALKWIIKEGKLRLEGASLNIRLFDGKIFQFVIFKANLINSTLQHEIKITGSILQKQKKAKFNIELKIRGSVTGKIILEDFIFEQIKQSTSKFKNDFFVLFPQSCDINFIIRDSKISSDFFRQPIDINKLNFNFISQKINNNSLKMNAQNIIFQDNYLNINGNLKLLFQEAFEMKNASANIKLNFKLANLAIAKLYYPTSLMPKDAVVWLDQAFIKSKQIFGTVLLNEGEFNAQANLNEVTLLYDKEWPTIKNICGKIHFKNSSMNIQVNTAKIFNSNIESVTAIIRDLDIPVLEINSKIKSDSKDGLRFLDSSPLKQTIASKLRGLTITGPMELILNLIIPISPNSELKETTIDGNIALNNNILNINNTKLIINNIDGQMHFTENDLTGKNITGKLFEQPLSATINTINSVTNINIEGESKISTIENIFDIDLSKHAEGDFKYQAILSLQSNKKLTDTLKLSSNLNGVAINLQNPLTKKSDEDTNLDITYNFIDKNPSLLVNYNNKLKALINLGETTTASINLNTLDWSLWSDYLSELKNPKNNKYKIKKINLNIEELLIFKQKIKKFNLLAIFNKNINSWDFNFNLPNFAGNVSIQANEPFRVKGVFSKLQLKKSNNISNVSPKKIPPLGLIFNNFSYENYNFNNISISTEPKDNGLKITNLSSTNQNFNLVASGDWTELSNNSQKTTLRGSITTKNLGNLLKQFNITENLLGGESKVFFDLKWSGSPYNMDTKNINGPVVISIHQGRIINFSKQTEKALGFGKMLNIFSLRNLPNFAGIVKQGFSFNSINCNATMVGTNAIIQKLVINGQVAHIEINGRIGLAAQDCDLIFKVTPYVTASVPAAAAFLGGPIVGLLGLVASDAILSPVLKKATSYNYRVIGPWDKPITKKF